MSVAYKIILVTSLSIALCLSEVKSPNFEGEKYAYEIIQQTPTTQAISPAGDVQTEPAKLKRSSSPTGRYPIAEFDLQHVYVPIVITLWLLLSNIFKILFQITPHIPKYLPESCALILLGLVIGVVLRFGMSSPFSPLTAKLFFLFILPPIIFDAGYFMPQRIFFNNLGTILLMAVIGTIFNIFAIAFSLWGCGLTGIYGGPAETPSLTSILLFTSVIAATDPVAVLAVFEEIHVNELLYIIVFGEALLNDAVTVVVYHVIEVYSQIGFKNVVSKDIISGLVSFFIVSLGGVMIGLLWALLTGYLTRFTHRVLIVETSFIFLMAYLAYLNAEMFHMSGILAATFCGIAMKSYVESNVSNNSKISIRNGIKTLANSAETVVFILLGVAAVQSHHVWNTPFVLLSVLFCTIFRIISVCLLSFISNYYRLYKLSTSDQVIMSLGGLRGAVAFALVLLIDQQLVPQKQMFLTTTLVIVFFTVFVQGIAVKPILKWLQIKLQDKRELSIYAKINERFLDHVMAGFEDIVGVNGNYNLLEKFKRFHKRFIKPLVLKDLNKPDYFTYILVRDDLQQVDAGGSVQNNIMDGKQMSNHRTCTFQLYSMKGGITNFGFKNEEDIKANLRRPKTTTLRREACGRFKTL